MNFLRALHLLNTKPPNIKKNSMLEKIISGGQTGVDRAALDAAIKLNISHGGWCPKGRKAELGEVIACHYQLRETDSDDYSVRTILNIKDADGTLIFVPSLPVTTNDGTILTIQGVKKSKKPYLILDLSKEDNLDNEINTWLEKYNIKTLNIAGPRESQSPGIYEKVFNLLTKTLRLIDKKEITLTAKI